MKHENNKVRSEEVVNSLGTGSIVELIQRELAGNPQSVSSVIDNVEAIVEATSPPLRVRVVADWVSKALWFGWHATLNFPLGERRLGPSPKFIKTDFLVNCVELGTKIAHFQMKRVAATVPK